MRNRSIMLLYLCSIIGCGGSGIEKNAKVTGVVTINGELARNGSVAFMPVSAGPTVYGSIRTDGTYSLKQGNASDTKNAQVPSGDYEVVVRSTLQLGEIKRIDEGGSAPPLPGNSLVPAEYSDPAKTPLKYTIKPGDNVINIAIEFDAEELDGDEDEEGLEDASAEALTEDASEPDASDSDATDEGETTSEPVEEGASS